MDHPIAFQLVRGVQVDVTHFEQFGQFGNVVQIGHGIAEYDERKWKIIDWYVGFFGQQRAKAGTFAETL